MVMRTTQHHIQNEILLLEVNQLNINDTPE